VIVRDFDALAVCGPTAAGKSEAAVLVAELLGGEIINADSRQVYRDMTIGTGAPSAASLPRVPHHLYAFVDPCRRYSAGEYVIDARSACDAIVSRGNLPIIVGGTGFYVDALRGSMPLDRPHGDDHVRARVRAEASTHPHEALREWLAAMSPDAAAKVTPGDRYRTLRAIEGVLARRSVAPPDPHMPIAPAPRVRVAVLAVETRELARRISSRVREMFDRGLVDEATSIAARCVDAPALTGLGYAEALGYVRGEITRDEAIRSAIARTCRYAKRQRTWFRRMRDALVVEGDDPRRSAEAIAEFARGTAQNT
jgi:tRNA dimethylallyltransferase